jgi:hypothetical protein
LGWPICGQLLARFWPTFGQFVANFWPLRGQLLAHFWPTFGQFVANFLRKKSPDAASKPPLQRGTGAKLAGPPAANQRALSPFADSRAPPRQQLAKCPFQKGQKSSNFLKNDKKTWRSNQVPRWTKDTSNVHDSVHHDGN